MAGFGRYLNSLAEPAQVLIRAEPIDLAPAIAELERAAPGLPHPGLEEAAREHARFLADLAATRDLLRREVLVVLRQPAGDGAAGRLRRRAEEASAALAAAGVTLEVLDRRRTRSLACPGPSTRVATDRRRGLGASSQVVTRGAATTRPEVARREPACSPSIRASAAARRIAVDAPSPFGPDGVEVGPRSLRIGEGWCRSFAVVGYPREVALGWLEPLASHPGRLDVSVHVEPVPAQIAADRLRRQLARLESGRRADAAKGRLGRPRGRGGGPRRPGAGGRSGPGRAEAVPGRAVPDGPCPERRGTRRRVRPGAGAVLVDAARCPGHHLADAAGVDHHAALGCRRAVAPAQLRHRRAGRLVPVRLGRAVRHLRRPLRHGGQGIGAGPAGIASPRTTTTRSSWPVRVRASPTWPSSRPSAACTPGIEVAVVDPEDEYRRLAEAVGGAYLHLGAPGVRLNPFDLRPGPEPLVRQALFLHTLVAVLLGRAARRRHQAGARPGHPRRLRVGRASPRIRGPTPARPRCSPTWPGRSRAGGRAGRSLASRLAPFVTGTHRGLFDGADHYPARGASGRLLPAGPARRAEGGRHPPHPGRGAGAGCRIPSAAGDGWWWWTRPGCSCPIPKGPSSSSGWPSRPGSTGAG